MADQDSDRYEYDELTGKTYKLTPEDEVASRRATFGGFYLLAAALILLYGLVVVWTNAFGWAEWLGLGQLADKAANSPLFHVFAFAMIGGGLGGILDEIRSFIKWHAEYNAYGKRFLWKTVLAPWQGAILGLIVVALLKAGLVVLGGDFNPESASSQQAVAMFAVGALAGYGSRSVLKWLDAQVTRTFATTPVNPKTPNLIGRSVQEAKDVLGDLGVNVGTITPPGATGKIKEQSPAPDVLIQRNVSVDLVVEQEAPAG